MDNAIGVATCQGSIIKKWGLPRFLQQTDSFRHKYWIFRTKG
jgi:hypothetical protein